MIHPTREVVQLADSKEATYISSIEAAFVDSCPKSVVGIENLRVKSASKSVIGKMSGHTLSLTSRSSTESTIELVTLSGRMIYRNSIQLSDGTVTTNLDNSISAGQYVLRIATPQLVTAEKVTLK